MTVYPVIITTETTAPLEVYGTGITYNELLNSFLAFNYKIKAIFVETQDFFQFDYPLQFTKFDSNGTKFIDVINIDVDPNQYIPSKLLKNLEKWFVIDSRLQMLFTVIPNGWIRFTFITDQTSLSEALDLFGRPNKDLINA